MKEMENRKYLKYLKFFGIILFIYILSKINISELIAIFKEINLIYYLIGVLFLIFGFLTRILRWKLLVESISIKCSFIKLVEMSAKGLFFGLITPAKMGEFWRARYLVEENRVSGGRAFYTAFMDRVLDLLIITVIGFLGFVVIYLKFARFWNWQLPLFVFVFLVVLIYFLGRKKRIQKIINFLIKFLLPDSFREKADYFLTEFYQGFSFLKLKLFIKILFWGFLYYLLSGVIFGYFTVLALGIIVPFWYFFLVMALVLLAISIPISIFGIGAREASFIYFFSFFNVPVSSAIALALLILFGNILVIALPGAILFLRQKRI